MARTYTKRVKTSVMDVNVSGLKINLKGLVELEKKLKNLPDIDVGYLKGEYHPVWNFTFAELANMNHFGTTGKNGDWKIPPRPFFNVALAGNNYLHIQLFRALQSAVTNKGQTAT